MLAGHPTLRELATRCGMSYEHLVGIANAREPLTANDQRDLAHALDVPSEWLRDGWAPTPRLCVPGARVAAAPND